MENRLQKTDENVLLIGFMGSGKSSVGKKLAGLLAVPCLDTDALIEEQEKMTIREIFAQRGQEYFRDAETRAVRGLTDRAGRYVLSVGGGLPLRSENREILKKLGTVIYLKASVQTLAERLARDTTRPLLQGEEPLEEKITRILSEREALYEEACSHVVLSDGKSVREVAQEIRRLIETL